MKIWDRIQDGKNSELHMKRLLYILFALTILFACKKDETLFVRETDRISFHTALAQSRNISLRCKGAWGSEIPEGCNWITLTPDGGTGSGEFIFIEVKVSDNRAAERSETIWFTYKGEKYPLTVTQAEGSLKWGTPELEGNLVVGNPCDASLKIAFSRAFGDETITLGATLEGDSDGIQINEKAFNLLDSEGTLVLPVEGTPEKAGYTDISVTVNGSVVGTLRSKVYSIDELPLEGLPVQWNFCETQGGNADRDALKSRQPDWATTHVLHADKGSGDIFIVEPDDKSASAVNGFAYNNGHAYFKGLYVNDAIVMRVPVRNLKENTAVTVSGSIGGSGSSAGFLIMEYSLDGTVWTEVPDAAKITLMDEEISYHAAVYDSFLASDGAFSCTFNVAETLLSGYLQVRLRVCADVRVTRDKTITTGGGGSTRLKGSFKITAEV